MMMMMIIIIIIIIIIILILGNRIGTLLTIIIPDLKNNADEELNLAYVRSDSRQFRRRNKATFTGGNVIYLCSNRPTS